MPKRKSLFTFFLIMLTCGLSIYGWNFFTTSKRYQKVQFTSSLKECYSGSLEQVFWIYCIYSAVEGTNGGLAYQFHGRNLDENTWNDADYYTGMTQKYWSEQKIKPPKVVSISFGPAWLFSPKSGLLEIFLNHVLPEIETKTGAPTYRIALGESMGGVNSLILGLRTKGYFKRISALCPPLYNGSPFAGLDEISAFFNRTGAEPWSILGILWLARQHARDEADWKMISPLDLLDSADPADSPAIYLNAGLYDKFGNYEGAERFAEKAKNSGFQIQWRPAFGGHCSIDIASLAESMLEP